MAAQQPLETAVFTLSNTKRANYGVSARILIVFAVEFDVILPGDAVGGSRMLVGAFTTPVEVTKIDRTYPVGSSSVYSTSRTH